MYYDIGIDANIVQPQQSLSSIGIVSLSSQVSVNQAVQYMTANANSVVITSPSPVVVVTVTESPSQYSATEEAANVWSSS